MSGRPSGLPMLTSRSVALLCEKRWAFFSGREAMASLALVGYGGTTEEQ
jgi:hypothetical protein